MGLVVGTDVVPQGLASITLGDGTIIWEPAPGGGAVTVLAVESGESHTGGVSSQTITCPVGTTKLVALNCVRDLGDSDRPISAVEITAGSLALFRCGTAADNSDGNSAADVWYRDNPPTGSQITVDMAHGGFIGSAQTTLIALGGAATGAEVSNASSIGSGADPSVTPSGSGGIIVACCSWNASGGFPTPTGTNVVAAATNANPRDRASAYAIPGVSIGFTRAAAAHALKAVRFAAA